MGLSERLQEDELARYSVNGYRGLPDKPTFEVIEGTTPVLVSAPHAVSHLRDGRLKPSEDYTGAIALELGRRCGAHVMVATSTGAGDPNWDPYDTNPYQQALVNYVDGHAIALVLDLHGMVAASPELVEIGTGDGVTVASWPGVDERAFSIISASVRPWCERWHKSAVLNGRHGARRTTTIAQVVASRTSAAALQIEVATQLRVPAICWHPIPKGERAPFSGEQVPAELLARRHPDPEAVEALVQALCEVIALMC